MIKKAFGVLDKLNKIKFMIWEESLTVEEKERISRTKSFSKPERVGRTTRGLGLAWPVVSVSFPGLITHICGHQLMKSKGLF